MIIAVDIGASKTLIASFDKTGSIVKQERFSTDKRFDTFINHLEKVLKHNFNPDEVESISVAAPGLINYQDGIFIAGGNLNWQNAPLKQTLGSRFKLPVLLENDAKAAAIAEARALVKNPAGPVLYLTISTGIGGGLVFNNQLVKELSWMEPGSMLLPNNGQLISWEKFASGRAIYKRYGKYAKDIKEPKIWQEIAHNLAIGIINLITILRPACIIIGGSIGAQFDHFRNDLIKELERIKPRMVSKIPLINKAVRPEEAVLYGCYYLAKKRNE